MSGDWACRHGNRAALSGAKKAGVVRNPCANVAASSEEKVRLAKKRGQRVSHGPRSRLFSQNRRLGSRPRFSSLFVRFASVVPICVRTNQRNIGKSLCVLLPGFEKMLAQPQHFIRWVLSIYERNGIQHSQNPAMRSKNSLVRYGVISGVLIANLPSIQVTSHGLAPSRRRRAVSVLVSMQGTFILRAPDVARAT